MQRQWRVAGLVFALALASAAVAADSISVAGTWRFGLAGGDTIFLPGSTDQGGYGTKTAGPEKGWLSRPSTFEGTAWYERDVVIPEAWRGKRITLFLERVHWQSRVWVDGAEAGARDSLSTPHVYDLSAALTPGRHTLRLAIDNSYRLNVGRNAHSFTEHTQTNWNGVVGRMELRAQEAVWIEGVRLFPDWKARRLRVEVTLGNATGGAVAGTVLVRVPRAPALRVPVKFAGREHTLEGVVALPASLRAWDEWTPAVHPVEVELTGRAADRWRGTFGLREMATKGTQFTLNGRPIFLRGTLECNIFPLTGYPPTDTDAWARLFRIARAHGLNHFRFHSACPPEAAFEAADRAGFLLHVELPIWTTVNDKDPALVEYLRAEGRRILRAYGNHPSFTMLCLGNELRGDYALLDRMLGEFKSEDARHLYTFSADHTATMPLANSDYYVGHRTKVGPIRIHGARLEKEPGGTDRDFTRETQGYTVPFVAHELGQWVVFPDYSEIGSYTGVLKPRNLEVFRDQLAARGMADQAGDFQRATGRFAWRLYKEDMETALRTPGFGGFQLLQLQDFPGQGEALVGLLDSFWNSKGILAPAEFRRFSNRTVPLLRSPKFVWTSAETLEARAEVAHYGMAPLESATAVWSVAAPHAKPVAAGRFERVNVPLGAVTPLGRIRVPLGGIASATRLRITLAVEGTDARNDWDIWVYPAATPVTVPEGIVVAADWAAARPALEAGGKVLLAWPPSRESASTVPSRFLPVFWSFTWFPKQPGTLGILCDPRHPALAGFPTEAYSDFEWWEPMQPSRAFILDDTPAGFRPIVQVIDDYHRNHKLGAVFETRVGRGRLLVTSLDVTSNPEGRPAARQLRRSLLDYMASEKFAPAAELSRAMLDKLLP
jgi:hypothetical protein